MRHILPLLAAAFLPLSTAPAAAQQCRPLDAGIVVGMDGGSRAYQLVRDGQPKAIRFYTELRGGDRLRLVALGHLRVQRADNGIGHAAETGPWFCIQAGQRLTWWDNLQRNFGELLTQVQEGADDLLTRDGSAFELAPAEVAAGTAHIAAGRRYLALTWNGGQPPFAVTIAREGQPPLVAVDDLRSRLLRLRDPRDLTPGRYSVKVRDADGNVASGGFTASGGIRQVRDSDEAMGLAGELLGSEPARPFEAFLVLSPYRSRKNLPSDLMNIVAAAE